MAAMGRRQFNLGAAAAMAAVATPGPAAATGPDGLAAFYERADGMDLAAAIRRGEYSAEAVLEEAIRRVEALNPALNAVTLKHYDLARERLRAGLPAGPLQGVPLLLKDLSDPLAGTATTGGSRSLVGIDAPASSPLVSRYLAAGLLPFGKTNVPEFGMALTTEPLAYGACHNPWNPARTTGGSSGGAAAAVAAGIVPFAHGTDGGGSIRVPAAACGVFGFKPTRAMTPRIGHSPSGMSISHVLSRSVRDSAFLLDISAGYLPGAPAAAPGRDGGFLGATQRKPPQLRIALNLDEPEVDLHPQCRAAVLALADTLARLGHVVEAAAPGLDYTALNQAQNTMMLSEFALGMQGIARLHGGRLDERHLEPLSLAMLEAGARLSAGEYIAAVQHAAALGARMAEFQQGWDLVLQPVTCNPPVPLGTINALPGDTVERFVQRFKREYSPYTHLYNMTGQPSAAIPVLTSEDGLPLAAMLSGRNGEDDLLFGVCAQVERARPWFNRRPDLRALAASS